MKRLLLGMAAGLAAVCAVLVIWWVSQDINGFITRNNGSLRGYEVAGTFYNAFYGLPLALFSALLVAVATLLGGLFALRQDDVKILEFTEGVVVDVIGVYRELVLRIGDLLHIGNQTRHHGAELYWRIEQEGGPDNSPLARLLLEAPHDGDVEDAIRYIEEELARGDLPPDYRELLAGSFLRLFRVREALNALCAVFERLGQSVYGNLFAQRQLADTPPNRRPLAWLKQRVPDALLDHGFYLDENSVGISQQISLAASGAELFAPARATALIADGSWTIEYLGLVLNPMFRTPVHPVATANGDGQVILYIINLGAAHLLAATQLAPEKSTIIKVFKEIFPSRGDIAVKFLKTAMPERRNLGPSYVLDGIAPCLDDLSHLLMVRVQRGQVVTTEFHDPARHGPIPGYGYHELGHVPTQQAV